MHAQGIYSTVVKSLFNDLLRCATSLTYFNVLVNLRDKHPVDDRRHLYGLLKFFNGDYRARHFKIRALHSNTAC